MIVRNVTLRMLARFMAAGVLASLAIVPAVAQQAITSPKDQLGFAIGDDYQLANYTRLAAYWHTLDEQSDRVSVVEYGKTSEGRPMLMAVVTSPANHARLEHFKSMARRLALADGLTDADAKQLAAEGKAVVWIDAGLHATEVANVPALTELVYELASRNDPETLKILDNVILLAAFSNPDGLELVADWYMREADPLKRSMANLPVLYQKFIGHDNNREFLLMNMPESEAVGRVLYREWFPQIMYNQHQTGPAGAVLYVGQMRDPSNPYLDPLMAPSMELVSAAIHTRFIAEGKPGATNRSMASYQNWWNGGIRSTACFHNQIAILSEISGSPTPITIDFVPKNLVATNDNPFPVQPQTWHFRQTIDYLLTADRAVLSVAAEHREAFLFNIYRMGKNAIDKGTRDTWTVSAKTVATVEAAAVKDGVRSQGRGGTPLKYYEAMRSPAARDPRGYIIPADQADFLTATKFVNALIKNGVAVDRATRAFEIGGRTYPAGSFVVKTAQAFRPHILDNFEPQDYPDDFAYPGGPPIRPYDVTGYTLAYQMGVQFDRMLEAFDGPFERIEGWAIPPAGKVTGQKASGFLLSHQVNDSVAAVNRLLAGGESVYWLKQPFTVGGKTYPVGTIYVPAAKSTAALVDKLARDISLTIEGINVRPSGDALRLKPVRVGVVDVYGGSMPSGWTQWLLGRFQFSYEVIYPPALDAGGLGARFDVLVVDAGLVSEPGRGEGRQPRLDPAAALPEYRDRIGAITEARTIPQLKRFVEEGGTIIAVGSSTSLATAFGLPLANALVDPNQSRPLPPEKFYIPGSILRAHVNTIDPLAYGLPEILDVFYSNNPLFRVPAGGPVRSVAWFGPDTVVRSGWAWGLDAVKGATTVAEADLGKGRLLLFGPPVAFRAHPHATFKFLFNGLHYAKAEPVTLRH
ncbi:MAG: M14 family metallopeptidase [Acidobacteria bacterium]|nr:M14 family metallopeptidase [Acidobacteriota bacterium]